MHCIRIAAPKPHLLSILISALLLAGGFLFGCASPSEAPSYEREVLQYRMEREMNLRDDNSVLSRAEREQFKGLNHYPVDSTYRYAVPLEAAPTPDTVWMPESTGGATSLARLGYVTVPFPQDTARLAVFRVDGQEDLWIPFADATNRTTTYPGGRYVDAARQSDGTLVVDFNKAYNPTCDYDPDYACPLPPSENRIAFDVPVGEQRSHVHAY